MRFHLNILPAIVAVVSANMRDMFPLEDRIQMLFMQGDITSEQKKYIMSKASKKMLRQQLVDRNKVDDADYDKLSGKDTKELSLWLDREVISEHMSAETANYARAVLDLGPSPFQEPNEQTFSDGPVDADYEGNGIVTKLAWRDYDPSVNSNDLYNGIWGYATGTREYALHTSHKGLNIFDVTDAEGDNIFLVQTIPMAGGRIWRDVAVTEDHYAYVAAQGGNNPDFFAIDLSELSGSAPHGEGSNPISQNKIINHGYTNWGHTINAWNGLVFINSAYSTRGCAILDVRDDPMNPKEVARYPDGDCHDSFAQKIYYKGQLRDLFFVADGYKRNFRIYDITDVRESDFQFNKIGKTPATSGIYAHENCVSDDGKTLFTFEEFNNYDIAAYDISDDNKLENPQLIRKFQYSLDDQADASVHNGFVRGNFLFVAYYAAGLRVFDISDVQNIVEVGKYDTYLDPDGDGMNNKNPTSQTKGAWNVYPYLPSGNILVSDLVYGLFVVKIDGSTVAPTKSASPTRTPSPTTSPTVSANPTATPTTHCSSVKGCCSNNFKDCVTWCGTSKNQCLSCSQDVHWIECPNQSCLPKYSACKEDPNGCCDGLTCVVDNPGYSQCRYVAPPPTAPDTPAPTAKNTPAPTANEVSSHPSLSPTETTSASPTSAEKPCSICDDRETDKMIKKGQDCASSAGVLDKRCNNNSKWRSNKWCQLSCNNSGNGYDGDVCCNDAPPTPATTPPTQAPTKACNVVCDDVETPKMIDNGQDCGSSTGTLNKKCNKSGKWIKKNYCQLSCYNSGNGYEGDVCCNGN